MVGEHQEMNLDEVVKEAIIIWVCVDIFCRIVDAWTKH